MKGVLGRFLVIARQAEQNASLAWIIARVLALIFALAGLTALPAHAQDGANPASPLIKSGSLFYGTTYNGGRYNLGAVYKMDTAGTVTVLYSFNGGDGSQPISALTEDSANPGTFYGVTRWGGANNHGVIYKITSAGAFTLLYSFDVTHGSEPEHGSALIKSGSLFYGMTGLGGANGKGVVYAFDPATNTVTVLHSFTGADGNDPAAALLLASDGKLYGSTYSGGANNKGVVFQITTAGAYTLLHSFTGTDGDGPNGALLQVNSNPLTLYGVTQNGGASGKGTVFSLTSTGSFTSLHSFTGTDGANPPVGLIASGSFYYGVTLFAGAAGIGNIFKVDGAGNVTSLHAFNNSDGKYPDAELLYNSTDGFFYSTAFNGGNFGNGTAYKMDTAGNVTVLHSCGGNPPVNLSAYSTGSGKISLYWDGVPNATGDNVYRGTTAGGENYAAPVNGTPIITPSYSGGNTYMFTDTGLANGVTYYYTVKALYSGVSSGPSNEDSTVPDLNGIPWDNSDPSVALNVIRAHYQNDPDAANLGQLRVAGPDGRIYEDGQLQVLPPDGTWDGASSTFQLASGELMAYQHGNPPANLEFEGGPYRRVRTVAMYTGVMGNFHVPTAADAEIGSRNIIVRGQQRSVPDGIYIYLGHSGTREVDAGLQWSQDAIRSKKGLEPLHFDSKGGTLHYQQPSRDKAIWLRSGYYGNLPCAN
ncbi:MAG TPA: choice-of-anchor tandem repeat GloVer-containing protein [Chthonomonadaceae bacterium]|nr:choice-of-anchor tandem repeat GloVer-containing protein [Chthonomonadaceae bacterium]